MYGSSHDVFRWFRRLLIHTTDVERLSSVVCVALCLQVVSTIAS